MTPEIIIIGGGVIGTACAYFLAKRGSKVLVLERSHLGAGASGTTAAIISIGGGSGTSELQPLNVESYHLILNAEKDFERPLEILFCIQYQVITFNIQGLQFRSATAAADTDYGCCGARSARAQMTTFQ